MALKWGIASSGLIANDFVNCLKVLPKDEHEVVAVAARSLSRSVAGIHKISLRPKPLSTLMRFFPVYQEVKSLLEAGKIGEVKHVSVTFGFPVTHVDRLRLKDLGGGAILDLGVYILQFQQFFYNGIDSEKITVAGHLTEEGVDDVASVIISYPGGKTAIVSCNATVQLPNEGVIVGTKGTIKIPMFWCPVSYELNGKIKKLPFIENNEKFNFPNSAGLAYEASEVRKHIMNKKIDCGTMPHKHTLQLAAWMDAVRKEIGVVFTADSDK